MHTNLPSMFSTASMALLWGSGLDRSRAWCRRRQLEFPALTIEEELRPLPAPINLSSRQETKVSGLFRAMKHESCKIDEFYGYSDRHLSTEHLNCIKHNTSIDKCRTSNQQSPSSLALPIYIDYFLRNCPRPFIWRMITAHCQNLLGSLRNPDNWVFDGNNTNDSLRNQNIFPADIDGEGIVKIAKASLQKMCSHQILPSDLKDVLAVLFFADAAMLVLLPEKYYALEALSNFDKIADKPLVRSKVLDCWFYGLWRTNRDLAAKKPLDDVPIDCCRLPQDEYDIFVKTRPEKASFTKNITNIKDQLLDSFIEELGLWRQCIHESDDRELFDKIAFLLWKKSSSCQPQPSGSTDDHTIYRRITATSRILRIFGKLLSKRNADPEQLFGSLMKEHQKDSQTKTPVHQPSPMPVFPQASEVSHIFDTAEGDVYWDLWDTNSDVQSMDDRWISSMPVEHHSFDSNSQQLLSHACDLGPTFQAVDSGGYWDILNRTVPESRSLDSHGTPISRGHYSTPQPPMSCSGSSGYIDKLSQSGQWEDDPGTYQEEVFSLWSQDRFQRKTLHLHASELTLSPESVGLELMWSLVKGIVIAIIILLLLVLSCASLYELLQQATGFDPQAVVSQVIFGTLMSIPPLEKPPDFNAVIQQTQMKFHSGEYLHVFEMTSNLIVDARLSYTCHFMLTGPERLEPAFAEFQECVQQYTRNYVDLLETHTLPLREGILEKASEVLQQTDSNRKRAGNDKQNFEGPDCEAGIPPHPEEFLTTSANVNAAGLCSPLNLGEGQLPSNSIDRLQDIDMFFGGLSPNPIATIEAASQTIVAVTPIQTADSFVNPPTPVHVDLEDSITAPIGSNIPPGPSSAPTTTKKTFICPTCNKKFAERHNRDRHVKHIHQGKGAIKCNHCNKTLSRKEYANRGHQARCSMRPVVGGIE